MTQKPRKPQSKRRRAVNAAILTVLAAVAVAAAIVGSL